MRIDCAFQVYGAVAAGRNLNDIQGDLRTQRRCFIICNIFIYLFNIIFIFKMQAFSHARQPLLMLYGHLNIAAAPFIMKQHVKVVPRVLQVCVK